MSWGTTAGSVQATQDLLKDGVIACKAEISGVCGKIQPGQGRIAACLIANKSTASKDCADAIQKVEAMGAAQYLECGRDTGLGARSDTTKINPVGAGEARRGQSLGAVVACATDHIEHREYFMLSSGIPGKIRAMVLSSMIFALNWTFDVMMSLAQAAIIWMTSPSSFRVLMVQLCIWPRTRLPSRMNPPPY